MKARTTVPVLLSLLTAVLLFAPPSVYAQFRQEQYYDWSTSDKRTPTVLGLTVKAQEETATTTPAETTTLTTDLAPAGFLPGNPLHFFETAYEGLQETFTLNPEAKAELKLQHAEERLSEAENLINSGNTQAGTQHLEVYEQKLTDATDDLTALKNQGIDVASLAEVVEQATARHTTVLEEVALKVPQEAAPVIQGVIYTSQLGMDKAADAKGEPPIPVDLLARMNALRGQGILSEDEASALTSAPSREEARKLFKGFVDQGVLPEADFKRFDTAQAKYLPEQFVKHVEMSKFNELKRLENAGAPSEEIKAQLQEFAAIFKAGDIVPPEIKRYWAQTIRLEEVQKTIRPDYIDSQLFAGRQEDFAKLQTLQDRVRPTAQEAALAEQYAKNNPGQSLPPEIQKILDLKEKLGILKEGFTPPPGHRESTFLPSSVLRFTGEIPFSSSGSNQGRGGQQQDYSKYFQGQNNFIGPLPPTFTTGGGAPTGTFGTTPGRTPEGNYFQQPPSGGSAGQEGSFRSPYYPQPPTSGTSGGGYQQPQPAGGSTSPSGGYTTPPTTSSPPPSDSGGSSPPPPSGDSGGSSPPPPSGGGGSQPPPPPPQ